jgi:hypothetical protein
MPRKGRNEADNQTRNLAFYRCCHRWNFNRHPVSGNQVRKILNQIKALPCSAPI